MTENSRLSSQKALQENTVRQFSELKKQVNEQNEYFTNETETSKKNQTEILEMKNSVKEIKNRLASTEVYLYLYIIYK